MSLEPAHQPEPDRAADGRANRADDEVLYYGYPGEPLANSIFPSMPGQVPWEYGGWAIEAMEAGDD